MKTILVLILCLCFTANLFAEETQTQTAPTEQGRHKKGRIIMTTLCAVAGFALGVALDLNDNLFDSNAMYWLAGVTGGAVGGYLIGNQLDKRSDRKKATEINRIQEEA